MDDIKGIMDFVDEKKFDDLELKILKEKVTNIKEKIEIFEHALLKSFSMDVDEKSFKNIEKAIEDTYKDLASASEDVSNKKAYIMRRGFETRKGFYKRKK